MSIKYVSPLIVLLLIALFSCENKRPESNSPSPLNEEEIAVFVEKGRLIATTTFAALSSKLQQALQQGGVKQAIAYCQLAALPLTDSLAVAHSADIRRTSLKVRNPQNAPTPAEKLILEEYGKTITARKALKPIVRKSEQGQIAFYAPIKVNAFCLQCHGELGQTLKEEDYAIIKERYPGDQALGYVDGDLRGMWSIQFTAK